MIWVLPGTRAYSLISILCVSGEFPARSIDLLGPRKMVRRTIASMSKKETYRLDESDFVEGVQKGKNVKKATGVMLHLTGSKSAGSIRLAKSGQNVLRELIPDEYAEFLSLHYTREEYGYYNDLNHTDRNHRVAETAAMMMLSDVEYRLPYMPELQDWCRNDGPCFYVAKAVKTAAGSAVDKNSGSRLTGVLMADTTAYAVFNTRQAVMRWSAPTEQKMQINLAGLLNRCAGGMAVDSAVLVGGPEMLARTLSALTARRHAGKSIVELYRNVYFVPMNAFGQVLLSMLTLPDWHNRLMNAIFKEGERNFFPNAFGKDYDGIRDGQKVICVIDGNIARMMRIKQEAELTGKRPIVICCKEQKTEISAFFSSKADVRSVPMPAVRQALGF